MRRLLAPPTTKEIEPAPPPTFSVIVAAYQVADVVGDALESVRRQTHPPLEVIVCDDGSTDDLGDALAPYRNEIVLLQKENGGEASAKNAAAKVAKGDFVAILDADDVYLPENLEALSDLAQTRPDLDILTTDALIVANGVPVRQVYDDSWHFEVNDQRIAILQRNLIFGLAAVRRQRLLDHGGFDESIRWTTDWDLWLRMILSGAAAGCVEESLAEYRLRETSLTAQRKNLLLGKLKTLEKARENPALRENERPVLEASLRSYRRELAVLELQADVAAGSAGTSRRAFSLLRARGMSTRLRLELAGIAAVPRLARRVLRRRAETTWTGGGGTRVSRPAG